MNTPLYNGIQHPQNSRSLHNYHKGLWFERFFNRYNNKWQVEDEQKQKWIDTVTKGDCGDNKTLSHHALQQQQLCNDLSGISKIFKTNGAFITGMGNSHPVENGFSWHPTLGTPYLSGASVKGLIRAWIEEWEDLDDKALSDKCLRWFGSQEKFPHGKQDTQAGGFIFFDALPVEAAQLHCDIMTPHMGDWYAKGGEITKKEYDTHLPADWHNPTLIPFLAVKKTSLQFCIAPRPHSDITEQDCQEAMEILAMALEYLGAGAKTATGYGRFEIDNKATEEQQEQAKQQAEQAAKEAKLAKLSPLEREIEEIIDHEATNPAMVLFNKLIDNTWESKEDQLVVAEKIKQLWKADKKWIPEFTGKNKQKVKQKNRCINLQSYLS